jgi:hypothetical protein
MVLQNKKNGTATISTKRGILVPQPLRHTTVYIQPKTGAQIQNPPTGQPDRHFVRNPISSRPPRQGSINHQHISSRFLNADQGSISSTFYEQLLCQYSYANPTGIQHIASSSGSQPFLTCSTLILKKSLAAHLWLEKSP